MNDKRTAISRFRRRREIRRLERQIAKLGTFIGNHGWYPGVRDDYKRLEAMKHELKEMTA